MEEERNTPQEQDDVEAHHLARDPNESLRHGAEQAADDDDEVEAHARREQHIWGPEARRE